jgi:AcrR family transcriptional regulator
MQLFATKGYEKSSIAEVAATIGTTGSNIFYHYRTKEDILVAILQHIREEMLRLFDSQIGHQPFASGMAMLEGMATGYLDLLNSHPEWVMLLHHRFPFEMAAENPTCRENLEAIYSCILNLFERAIRKGQSDGSVLQTPPQKAAMIVFAMVDGVVRFKTYNLYEAGSLYGELMNACRRMLQPNHCPP